MSDVMDRIRENASPREFVLAYSAGGRSIHLVDTADLDAADEGEEVRSECSRPSTWSPVENQTRTDHSTDDLCSNCIRTGYARGHLRSPRPFTPEELGVTP